MSSYRLLEDGTSRRLLEDGTSFRVLEDHVGAVASPGTVQFREGILRRQFGELTLSRST